MFSSIRVRNFQSLRSVDLELGQLTVVVGPSSSGKSALLRAFRLLTCNARGSSFVSNGEDSSVVQVSDELTTVAIERGSSKGSYKVLEGGKEAVFTKLGGTVPPEVLKALRVSPWADHSLHFAGQFDRPFLLDDSGAEVARVLGSLTNVSLIFGAVREANRRRSAVNTELKLRRADLTNVHLKLKAYSGLAGRKSIVAAAEEAYGRAVVLESKLQLLRSLLEDKPELTYSSSEAVPEFDLLSKEYSYKNLKSCIAQYRKAVQDLESAQSVQSEAGRLTDSLHSRMHTLLQQAGVCPTCRQVIREN